VRILVTGGAGFIGSHVAEAALAAGHEVAILDDLSSGRREFLPEGATFVEADLRGDETVRFTEEFAPEAVMHLAAQISVTKSVDGFLWDADINLIGSLRLLEAAMRGPLKRFVFSSSGGAIYGEQEVVPCDETHPATPLSPYGLGKYAFEEYLRILSLHNGFEPVSLRYSNVYGPRQNPSGEAGVIAVFARRLLGGQECTIYGDGEQTRDFVYVDDVAAANLAGLTAPVGVYNIGTATEVTVNELYRQMARVVGREDEPKRAPGKPGETRRSSLLAGLAAESFDWRPQVGFEEGLRRTVEWFEANPGIS
jgi:UDP-glucose 4-epimerase